MAQFLEITVLCEITTGTESVGMCLSSTGGPLDVNAKHSTSLRLCLSNWYFLQRLL